MLLFIYWGWCQQKAAYLCDVIENYLWIILKPNLFQWTHTVYLYCSQTDGRGNPYARNGCEMALPSFVVQSVEMHNLDQVHREQPGSELDIIDVYVWWRFQSSITGDVFTVHTRATPHQLTVLKLGKRTSVRICFEPRSELGRALTFEALKELIVT